MKVVNIRSTKYGTVMQVSADRLLGKRTDQPYYAAKIRVHDPRITDNDRVQIIPGMPTQVYIKTGRGTVALYALRPLRDSLNNAFHEDRTAVRKRPRDDIMTMSRPATTCGRTVRTIVRCNEGPLRCGCEPSISA